MRMFPDESLSERNSPPFPPKKQPQHPDARRGKTHRGKAHRGKAQIIDADGASTPGASTPRTQHKPSHQPEHRAEQQVERKNQNTPQRRCLVSGARAPAAQMIRLAISADGAVVPDILAKAPGRGGWIAVDQHQLSAAIAKGRLRATLARAFKDSAITVTTDLATRIADQLAQTALARLGLEARAGYLLTGGERIAGATRKGTLVLLLHAADAAPDSCRKLAQGWQARQRHNTNIPNARYKAEDRDIAEQTATPNIPACQILILPANRNALSLALGRANAVHVGIIDRGAAQRLLDCVVRWQSYIGWDRGWDRDTTALHSPANKTANKNKTENQNIDRSEGLVG